MDWDFSIERNREWLLGAVVALFALIGLVEGGMVERLSRPLYRKVLGKVKAAEAAVRRLIIVAARDIVVEPRPKRPAPKRPIRSKQRQIPSKTKAKPKTKAKAARHPSHYATRKSAPMPADLVAGGGNTKAPSPAFVSWITIRGFRGSFEGQTRRPHRSWRRKSPSKTTPSAPSACAAVSSPSCAR